MSRESLTQCFKPKKFDPRDCAGCEVYVFVLRCQAYPRLSLCRPSPIWSVVSSPRSVLYLRGGMTPSQMRKLDTGLCEYIESMVADMGRLECRRAMAL